MDIVQPPSRVHLATASTPPTRPNPGVPPRAGTTPCIFKSTWLARVDHTNSTASNSAEENNGTSHRS